MITLGLATIFPAVILKYGTLTGGTTGKMPRDKLVPPEWTPWDAHDRMGPPTYRYFVIVAIAALMFLLARNLVRSRVGRALVAQRDNQTDAATSGVNVAIYKTLAFGTSAAFAGIAGSLLMIQQPQATETKFGVMLAIYLFIGLVLGGVAIISGAIPGAILFVFVPYYTIRDGARTSRSWRAGSSPPPICCTASCCWRSSSSSRAGSWTGSDEWAPESLRIRPNPSWLPGTPVSDE